MEELSCGSVVVEAVHAVQRRKSFESFTSSAESLHGFNAGDGPAASYQGLNVCFKVGLGDRRGRRGGHGWCWGKQYRCERNKRRAWFYPTGLVMFDGERARGGTAQDMVYWIHIWAHILIFIADDFLVFVFSLDGEAEQDPRNALRGAQVDIAFLEASKSKDLWEPYKQDIQKLRRTARLAFPDDTFCVFAVKVTRSLGNRKIKVRRKTTTGPGGSC